MVDPGRFDDLPPSAAWAHEGARAGFETVFMRAGAGGYGFSGHTAAVEDGRPWAVRYEIGVDALWRTRTADVWLWNADRASRVSLRHDGAGRWTVNGAPAAHLDGCMDVDLESTAWAARRTTTRRRGSSSRPGSSTTGAAWCCAIPASQNERCDRER